MSAPADETPALLSTRAMWGLGGLTTWQFVRRLARELTRQRIPGRSAQFAYYALFATAPLLILLIAAAALLPVGGVLDSFLNAIEAGMPENAYTVLRRQIDSILGATNWGLVAGATVLLAASGSRALMTLGEGLDVAYGVERSRRYLRARLISALMAYLLLILMVLTMLLLVFGPNLARAVLEEIQLKSLEGPVYHAVRWGIAAGFMLLSSSLLYWIIPHRRLRWHWISPGSLCATLGWVIVTVGLGIYIDSFGRFNQTYGTLGGFVALLVWFHLTGYTLLTGGVVNGVIVRATEERERDSQ